MSKQKQAQQILFQAGYDFRRGASDVIHVQPLQRTKYGWRVPRGQHALCGESATRVIYDIDNIDDEQLCQGCLRQILRA